jgi:putative transposase
VLADVQAQGFRVGRNKVIAVMREYSLYGRKQRRFKVTTRSDENARIHDNKLQQNFSRPQPNSAWVTDITYVQTIQGWLYLSVIIDLFSRRVVGYAVDNHMRTSLVETSLLRAIGQRKPANGIIHHSDRGCQYTSNDYLDLLTQQGFEISMSGKGNCFDNAVAESFFASFKKERLYRLPLQEDECCIALIDNYIQFYNSKRRHSSLGYLSPVDWELKASLKGALLV